MTNAISSRCGVIVSLFFLLHAVSAFAPYKSASFTRTTIRSQSPFTLIANRNDDNNNDSIRQSTSYLGSSTPKSTGDTDLQNAEGSGETDEMHFEREAFTMLPRHDTHEAVNEVLSQAEDIIKKLYEESSECMMDDDGCKPEEIEEVFANSYVDLGKVDTVGFDYDYTLVTYNKDLLTLIYDMTLKRLVNEYQYPLELLDAGMKFDPKFSVRGLAVDRETGWICHLSYTHKVSVAYEGREKVSRERLIKEYRGKRALKPSERKIRLKPLNDLFSMAECCLIADVVQFFIDKNMPFCPKNAVVDVLDAIGRTHISGDFHRLVADDPGKYFEPRPHLKQVLKTLKDSGKRLIFVSNSPFWYVDAGMRYVIGDHWREMWDATIVSAGKPRFYTEDARPFRQVCQTTGRVQFKKVTELESGEVYAEGCLKELTKCIQWTSVSVEIQSDNDVQTQVTGGSSLASPNVLYIGDSLFADLVDAKRDFGWTTAAVTPEVGWERKLQTQVEYTNAQKVVDLLLRTLRETQLIMGNGNRSNQDLEVIDQLERMVSIWREEQNKLLGNPFGSVFRAKYQPSLFAHSLRRYCDLYMPNISALRHYSPQHRFYPNDTRLLNHEIPDIAAECWDELLE